MILGVVLPPLRFGALWTKLPASGEPAYQGKSLSVWLRKQEEARFNTRVSLFA